MTDATPYGRRFVAVLMALLMVTSVFGPVGTVAAAPGVSVSHANSQTTVNPGETVTITATFVQSEANSPGMEPDVPDGWSITQATAGTDWSWVSQQQAFLGSLSLSDSDGVNGTYTHTYTVQVPGDAAEGDYTITSEGSVVDPESGNPISDSASTTVSVEEENTAPTADAGADQTVEEGTTVTLDASGSTDSDGSIASYSWTQTGGTPSVTLNDASTATPTFTAPGVTSDTTLTFEVEVTDDDGATATDTVDVTVQPEANTPPEAMFTAQFNTPLTTETSVTFNASGSSDQDGSIVNYEWDFNDDGTFEESTTNAQVQHTFPSAGDKTVTLKVTDDGGATDTTSTQITVEEPANTAPTIEPITDQGVSQGGSTSVGVSASDDDSGDTPSLSVSSGPSWVTITDNGDGTGTVNIDPGTSVSVGTYTVEVTADDGQASATEEFAVYVDEPDRDGEVVFAVNAGGPEYTANDGTVYEADSANQYYTGGSTTVTGQAGIPADPDIANTDDDTLYESERFGDFSYDIPVSQPGTYEVTLKFAEIYQGVSSNDSPDASGPTDGTNENDRLFDVSIEGQQVISSYDIFSEVGPLNASDKTYQVEVTDGTLNVDFSTVNDNAKISAIKVERLSVPAAGALSFTNQSLGADGEVTVENVSTDQPSTLVVTYTNDSGDEIVAGTASADNLDDQNVSVAIEDAGGFPGEHTAWLFADEDLDVSLGPGDDVLAATGLTASQVQDLALDFDSAQVTFRPIGVLKNPPTDPDNDGKFGDVNGDGDVNVGDVQALFANSQDPVVQNNTAAFDFNNDGSVNVGDVQALFAKGIGV